MRAAGDCRRTRSENIPATIDVPDRRYRPSAGRPGRILGKTLEYKPGKTGASQSGFTQKESMKTDESDIETIARRTVRELESMADPVNAAGMARFGIRTENALGISVKNIRALGKRLGKNTPLALALMRERYHEAHLLAFVVMRADDLSPEQMDGIAATLDSWDTCDLFCGEIATHPQALRKVFQWIRDEREFVRRAGFSLVARMAVRCKQMPDEAFQALLALVEHYGDDPRPMVGKSIDWALRQIGKRSTFLHPYALSLAGKMAGSDNRYVRRIGRVSARELSRPEVIARLRPHTVWPEEGVVDMPGYC